MELPIYKTRVVAFIDILGFKDLISQLPQDPDIHFRIHRALSRIKVIEKFTELPHLENSIEVSVFSDSIAISSEEKNIESLFWTVGFLQADLLCLGVLVRGGIAIGKTTHSSGLLYGEGMIEAHDLEQQAHFPRVVVASDVVRKNQNLKKWLIVDKFGFASVNPFKFDAMVGGAEDLAADGYDPRFCYYKEVRSHLINKLTTLKAPRHLEKWKWMAEYFNEAAVIFNEKSTEKIEIIEL